MSDSPLKPVPHGQQTDGVTDAGRWMALAAALLGWMFDGAEMGLFSMVGRPAVKDLIAHERVLDPAEVALWRQKTLLLLRDSTSLGGPIDRDQAPPALKSDFTRLDANRDGKLEAAEIEKADPPVDESQIALYFGVIIALFLVGAASGGVLFGWLGDRIGRVRAMALSVLVYAIFTGLCGFVTQVWQLGLLRFIASLGMGGEWALGVSLVMEVWPNRSRAFMAGLIGAAANVGYLFVALAGMGLNAFIQDFSKLLLSVGLPTETVAHLVQADGWRLMMMLGTTPAILTVFFRLFVPESQKWEAENEKGTTSHWATADLLGVVVGALGPGLIIWAMVSPWHWSLKVLATLAGLAVAAVGYTYPVQRFLQRQEEEGQGESRWRGILGMMLLGAGLSGVALLGTWGATQWSPTWASQLTEKNPVPNAKEWTLFWTSVGAIAGTIFAAMTGEWLGRRITYFLLCLLSLLSCWGLYKLNAAYGPGFLTWVCVQGFFTASFYGWLPLYLPELFPTSVRATGQGFAFNFGRILAAVGALNSGALFAWFNKDYAVACSWMCLIYLVGMVLIWFAPETKDQPLPE